MNVDLVQPQGNPHTQVFDEVVISLKSALRPLIPKIGLGARNGVLVGWHLLKSDDLLTLAQTRIVYNFEPLCGPNSMYIKMLCQLPNGTVVWDYNSCNVEILKSQCPHLVPIHVPFCYDPAIVRKVSAREKKYDVLFYGSLNERRSWVLNQLKRRGLRVKSLFNVYKDERDRIIDESILIVNIHYASPLLESPRLVPLWSSGVPVLSESSLGGYVDNSINQAPCFADYSCLVDLCVHLVLSAPHRVWLAQEMQQRVRRVVYSDVLEEAIVKTFKLARV